MKIKEVKEISKLIPTFIMMCENNLQEDEHNIKTPLTLEQFEQVSKLITKLKNCEQFVIQDIFK